MGEQIWVFKQLQSKPQELCKAPSSHTHGGKKAAYYGTPNFLHHRGTEEELLGKGAEGDG